MKNYRKTNNPDKVGKDAKQIIFFEELRGESLEAVVQYWVTVNKVGTINKEIKNKIKEIEILTDKL
jgi:hypothetical protein